VLSVVALVWGVAAAMRWAWTCDDAFISFRYAKNLIDGVGLVYNAGERVEGYSNLLWTLWIAAGLRLGLDAEIWSMAWGIAAYGVCIGLLAMRCARRARGIGGRAVALPIAALAAAAHPDWGVFATSGLETSLMTLLGLVGFLCVIEAESRPARAWWAGVAFGLAAVTRPEGVLLGAATTGFLLARRVPRRVVVGVTAPWLVSCLAQVTTRFVFYGDLLPNTYYAKSADLAWFDQGWTYTVLYFAKYWVLAAGALAALVLLVLPRGRSPAREADCWRAEATLALVLAAVQILFVMRVGGDFMYARLLIPTAPCCLILTEVVAERWTRRRRDAALAATALVVFGVWLTPHPFEGRAEVQGIIHERLDYPPEKCIAQRRKGETLRRLFQGLPVRVAFSGSEARVVYYSEVPVAIECSTGLTDRFIARRPLAKRGRVGHEKRPTTSYLLDVRGVQLDLHPEFAREFMLGDSALSIPIRFGTARAGVLRWDPGLMRELQRRGARFEEPAEGFTVAAAASRVWHAGPRTVGEELPPQPP
jgi:hypothetical protein